MLELRKLLHINSLGCPISLIQWTSDLVFNGFRLILKQREVLLRSQAPKKSFSLRGADSRFDSCRSLLT